ncbi:uncharacterized protein Dwil_GK10263, isoform B [Drosophila willistoni]|uniref:Uncharacterized protein, isoform B n=1 Tax=Drosophila willistoni TaxID=7260 RepID=A0A0Q9WNL8_DROWI|nr:plexin domain-containing protein 2 isoform X1 [Drosophila willistoni]KRF97514.1 uncharacterized protein Dwil_GK10263, isoform B [Drosophila willistoni]
MTKSVGVCAQLAILLTIGCLTQTRAANSWADSYHTIGTKSIYTDIHDVVKLPADQSHRQRRAVLPDNITTPSPDVKNQYQSVNANASVSSTVTDTMVTTVDSKAAGSLAYNIHNVGVNGTGQRKDYSVQSSDGTATAAGTASTTINTAAKKPTSLLASQPQYPKKVAATSVTQSHSQSTTTERPLVDDVDISEEKINSGMTNQSLERREDHHDYYNSALYINKEEAVKMWSQLRNIPNNTMLSSSHRRAMTVELKFDFPFYGHYVRNITVATGGFLYTGEYVHSWLAATQYIAPLMANFDTSILSESVVRFFDNGTAFSAVWENVTLQDKPDYGKFTFSATLHSNGDIVFGYYQVPTLINTIQDNQHPVKVGLSDAYIIDKFLYFARRKTIYEYHRVSFTQQEITNATIIKLTALPTCLGFNDCASCINHNTTFACSWCPALNRCSTGTDRKKHEWTQKGCDEAAITKLSSCPALGVKGNNAAQEKSKQNDLIDANSRQITSTTVVSHSSTAATEPTVSTVRPPQPSSTSNTDENNSWHTNSDHLDAKLSQAEVDNKNVGVAFGFMVPICLVSVIALWLFYAYRNPHTKSGQLLIQSKHLHQFRPSQWSWRRGEARYTAATIHM